MPLSAAAKEICDFAQAVHQPVSELVDEALTVEYDLIEEKRLESKAIKESIVTELTIISS